MKYYALKLIKPNTKGDAYIKAYPKGGIMMIGNDCSVTEDLQEAYLFTEEKFISINNELPRHWLPLLVIISVSRKESLEWVAGLNIVNF